MKKLVLVFGLFLLSTSLIFPQSGWNRQYSGTTNDLMNTFFTDSLHGVTVGNGGIILLTTDGGDNWMQKNSGTTNNLAFVTFVNHQVGTIVGVGGIMLRTEDGGETWFQQNSGLTGTLYAVSFYDENNGVAVGGSTIIRTTNGGDSWEILSSGILESNFVRVQYFDYNNILILYRYYFIYLNCYAGVHKTTDAGITWSSKQIISLGSAGEVNDAKFINSNVGFAVGWAGKVTVYGGFVLKTTDGGNNWFQISTNWLPMLSSVDFMDLNNGIVVSENGMGIYRTTDGGTNWAPHLVRSTTGMDRFYNSVFFADQNHGTIVGSYGLIFSTKTGGINSISSEWFISNSSTDVNLMSIFLTSPETGVCVGAYKVIRTTDGGLSWSDSSLNFRCYDVFFINQEYGSIVGLRGTGSEDGKMWNTSNGGLDWQEYTFDQSLIEMGYRIAKGIHYIDFMRRIIVAQYGRILYTLDAGVSWSKSDSVTAWDLRDLSFPNDIVGYVVGDRGTLLKSTDSGISWNVLQTNTDNNLNGVSFRDVNNGIVVSNFGKIYKTMDGGITWTEPESGTYNHLHKIGFENNDNGIIVGEFGTILKTQDGGNTWIREESGTSINLNDISLSDSSAITVGGWGVILTKIDPTTGNRDIESEIPSSYNLSQNFPNPFNPSTKIIYQLPNAGSLKLTVFDILGKEVATLVDEYKNAGNYVVEFNASHLPSGVYFYQIRVGDFIEGKKMILLK